MSNGFTPSYRKHLSAQFQQLRLERNLTIAEIALKSNLSIRHIELIEQGQHFSFEKYKALAFFYGKKIKVSLE